MSSMRMIMLTLALAALTAPLAAQHLDGAWLADPNYGGASDTVVKEVKRQIADYTEAKTKAEAIQRGELEGDLRSAQQECVDTALYSWVQANYLAEMGRMARVAGNAEQAKADYKAALKAAKKAQTADCNEEAKTAKGKEQGAIIERVIRRALKRLGVEA